MNSEKYIGLIKTVFNSPDGELLLSELKERLVYCKVIDTMDSNSVYMTLGRESVILELEQLAKSDPTAFNDIGEYLTGEDEND